MMQKETSGSAPDHPQSVTHPGYPYPPEELWRRLVEVIKTPPDELGYRKLGQIFGLGFDEDKMLWYGDKASRKYFVLSTSDIKSKEVFPFHQISLSQGDPDPAASVRVRRMAFDFYLYDPKIGREAMTERTALYCVKPEFSELEAQGFVHDRGPKELLPRDRYGNLALEPYRSEFFADKLGFPQKHTKQVVLKILLSGCLVGISYINYPKF